MDTYTIFQENEEKIVRTELRFSKFYDNET